MRFLFAALAITTSAIPAIAGAQGWNDPRYRQEQRDNRQDYREERREDRRDYLDERRDDRRDLARGAVSLAEYRRDRARDDAHYSREQRDNLRDFRQETREDRRDAWNRDWRRDTRYDWNRYRTANRSAYHLPRYYGPTGWSGGYRRFAIGYPLARPLWGRPYWIGNPYAYRLPPAYGPYRWVRYYNDALLIDTRRGTVVDSAYGIFW